MTHRDEIEPGWYVLMCKQHAERRVLTELEGVRLLAYCPMERRMVRHSGRSRPVERPFVPGYAFVMLEGAGDYHTARTTEGVSDFLRHTDRSPARVDAADVLSIHFLEVCGLFDSTPKVGREFTAGEAVRVTRGQFREWIGTFVGKRNAKQVEVSICRPGSKAAYPMVVEAKILEAA